MGFWRRILGGTTESSSQSGDVPFPLRFDVIPDRLSVSVYLHDIETRDYSVSCWTYVSDGLYALGQKEFVFTLRRERREQPGDVPRDPVRFVEQVYAMAKEGRIVHEGGFTQFGTRGLLGREGLVYTRPQKLVDIEVTAPSLSVILVTKEEVEAAQAFGVTRVLARLGKAHRCYPFPPWSDRTRPSLPLASASQSTWLTQMARIHQRGATVQTDHGVIKLLLTEDAGQVLAERLQDIPADVAVALLTEFADEADACLVWEPGQTGPEAISAPGGTGSRVGGCFIAFLPGQDEDTSQLLEDGFAAMLTEATWRSIKAALDSKESLSVPTGNDGKSFSLEWVTE